MQNTDVFFLVGFKEGDTVEKTHITTRKELTQPQKLERRGREDISY